VKGLIAFALVLAFLLPLAALYAFNNSGVESTASAKRLVLALEGKHFLESGFKNGLRQALASAKGGTARERSAFVAERLVEFEAFFEQNAVADVWAGVAGERELADLLSKTRAAGKPVKCVKCFDLNAFSADYEGKPVRRTQAFLFYDAVEGQVRVSRKGLAFAPEPLALAGKPLFGATVFFPETNSSAVFAVSEGFE